jgi:hypothetical protein
MGALSACSGTVDAYVANPCDRPVAVRTWMGPPKYVSTRAADATGTVPAHSVKKIEGAFSDDPAGQFAYSMDGAALLPFDAKHWVHRTIVIPSSAC